MALSVLIPRGIVVSDPVRSNTRGKVLGVLLFAAGFALLHAQGLQPDHSFAPRLLSPASLSSITALPDGEFLVYGFDAVEANDTVIARLARLKPDGSLDPTFNYQESVWDSSLQFAPLANGQILVFRLPRNGNQPNAFFRLNADGSIDPSFATQSTLTPAVFSPWIVDPERRVYAVTIIGSRREIVRYGADGILDRSFTASFVRSDGVSAAVTGMVPLAGGKLLVAGFFDTPSGSISSLARLAPDGTRDSSYVFRGSYSGIGRLAALPDGRLLLQATRSPSSSATLLRIEQDGTVDPSFAFGVANVSVSAFQPLAGGRVVVSFVRNAPTAGARLNTLGLFRADGSLERELGASLPGTAFTLLGFTLDGGAVVSISSNSVPTTYLLRPDGSVSTDFFPRMRTVAAISSVLGLRDGGVLVAGRFSTANGVPRSGLAHLHADGSVGTAYQAANPPSGTPSPTSLTPIAERDDGSILVQAIRPTGRVLMFLRRDGTVDPGFVPDTAIREVSAALILPGGQVLCGTVSGVGADVQGGLALLGPNGSLVRAIALPVQGALVTALRRSAAGRISLQLTAGSATAARTLTPFLRLNPDLTLDQTFEPASPDLVRDRAVFEDFPAVEPTGDGGFVAYSSAGNLNQQVRRYTADGAAVASFPRVPSFGQIFAILLAREDDTVVSVEHRYADFAKQIRLLRHDGSRAPTDVQLDAEFNAFRLSNAPGGAVYIFGRLRTVGGQRSFGLARLVPDPAELIAESPRSVTTVAGREVSLRVTSGAPMVATYQWRRDGVAVPDATRAELVLPAVDGGQAGVYEVVVSVGSRQAVSATARVEVTPNTAHLLNISGAVAVGPGTANAVTGFVLHGEARRVLVRGVGPGLRQLGVHDPLAAAQLSVFSGSHLAGESRQWGGGAELREVFAAVGAFPLPADSLDAALTLTLPAGDASAVLAPVEGGSRGTGIIEFYDRAPDGTRAIRNVSVRGEAGRNGATITAGFVIGGSGPAWVLLRGIGPRLHDFGVEQALSNPRLRLFWQRTNSVPYAENDDWTPQTGDGADIAGMAARAGAFSLAANSSDSALSLRLEPGAYTAVLDSVDGTSGIALVEAYLVER